MVFFLLLSFKDAGEAPEPTLVYRKWGSAPSLRARCARRFSDVAGVMGWIDGWASGHNPLRSSQGLEGIMIRCVGAALRGDGNPPEVPVIRTVLRAYNGVWGVPIKHMSAALCAHKCRACRTTLRSKV